MAKKKNRKSRKRQDVKAAPQTKSMQQAETTAATGNEEIYRDRFGRHFEELKWLYIELYGNDSMFAELCDNIDRKSVV